MKPKVPVDVNIAYEINPRHEATTPKTWNIIQTGYNKPRRVYTKVTMTKESAPVWLLHPREPKAYSAKKQKDIHTDIAHSAESKERIPTRKLHMKEYDKEHCGAH